jgi:tetrahydromethanopterin S-methyltransferase subunit H
MPYRYVFLFVAGMTAIVSVVTANIASRAVVVTSPNEQARAILPIDAIVDKLVEYIY